jgi:hypothetical protein
VYVVSTCNVTRLSKSKEDKMEELGLDGKVILKWVLTEIENEAVTSIHRAEDRNHWPAASTW